MRDRTLGNFVLGLPGGTKALVHQVYHRLAAPFRNYDGKIRLSEQLFADFGRHRSGWSYAVNSLRALHNPDGVYFDSFIERTFSWARDEIRPHTEPWIGIIHVPPQVPEYFPQAQTNDAIFTLPAWRESLNHCRGLYTLSSYHRNQLSTRLELPIESLIHPCERPRLNWSLERFTANRNRKIVQIGWFLRKMHAIHQLPPSSYSKAAAGLASKAYITDIFERESHFLRERGESVDDNGDVELLPFLSNEAYDRLLSENLVFIYLWDASANNLIVECMVRHCPILVNRVGGVAEYLGAGYPLYYTSAEEAIAKAEDLKMVEAAHGYLRENPKLAQLTGMYFQESIRNSEIYRAL